MFFFSQQANYVDLAQPCKQFILAMSTEYKLEETKMYRFAKSTKAIAEKRLLFELVVFPGCNEIPGKMFHSHVIKNIVPQLKTKLKEKKMKEAISDLKDDKCFQFLSSVGQTVNNETYISQEDKILLPEVNATNVMIGDVSKSKENEETKRKKRILEERDMLTSQETIEADTDRV